MPTFACPTCRNGRVLSVAGPALVYVVCPDCADATGIYTQTGVPTWTLNPERQWRTIQRYRQARYPERQVA